MSKLKYKEDRLLYRILNTKVIVLLSNIIFQGLRYMSPGERLFKISVTIIFALALNLLLGNLILCLVLGHLINYVFNGQFYVVFRYLSSKRTMSRTDLNEYIILIESAIKKFRPLDVLVIGSFSRGKMGKSSDLDIRIFHSPDIFSSLQAYLMASYLRLMGLFMKFPIDVFCFSELEFLDKLDKKEVPVNFTNNQKILDKYPDSKNYQPHIKTLKIA